MEKEKRFEYIDFTAYVLLWSEEYGCGVAHHPDGGSFIVTRATEAESGHIAELMRGHVEKFNALIGKSSTQPHEPK